MAINHERQKLITCLLDEVMPEVHRTRDPEAVLLKTANEHNLPIAQLEMMGHLFNTARTIHYLDKSASQGTERGGSFPLLDVPHMLGAYIDPEVPATNKKADAAWVDESWTDMPLEGLPACLASLLADPAVEKVAAEKSAADFREEERQALVTECQRRHEHDFFVQQAFDARENFYEKVGRVMRTLRQEPEADFEKASAEVLALQGESARPMLELVADHLRATHLNVKVAAVPADWSEDAFGLTTELTEAQALLHVRTAALELAAEKAASKVAAAEEEDAEDGGGVSDFGLRAPNSRLFRDVSLPAVKWVGKNFAMNPDPGDPVKLKQRKEYEGTIRTAQQGALLNRLLWTDDVLSEADPHHVSEAYDTVRRMAPDISTDPNVMRSVLRLAVHSGGVTDPNTLKQIIDAAAAHRALSTDRQAKDIKVQPPADAVRPGK